MKKCFYTMLIISATASLLFGCGDATDAVDITEGDGAIEVTGVTDGAQFENGFSIGSLLGTKEEAVYEPEKINNDIELTTAKMGDYSSIFASEVKTNVVNGDVSIVIGGYEFDVDSDTYCTYFESVGPAFVLGDKVQYKIKVQDRTNEEIKKIDVTEKVKDLGGKILKGPDTVIDGDLEYIFFEYELDGERGAAVNMPGPDPKHAIGVQLALLDDSVNSAAAAKQALVVAKTAKITTKPDTTADEIKDIYGNSWVSGTTVKNASLSVDGKTYTFSVPAGYKQNWEDTDDTLDLKFFSNGEVSVSVTFSTSKYSDSKYYMENMWAWKYAEHKSDIMLTDDGRIAYGIYEEEEPTYYGVEAGMVIEGVGCVCVEGESDNRKVTLDDIIGFFDNDSPENKREVGSLVAKTAIDYDQIYMGKVDDVAVAKDIIAEYGRIQREKYSNPEVEKIERRLEEKYDICAVNLGEMDVETAKDVEKAVSYMFDTYPIIQGSLNTISLANLTRDELNFMAVTRTTDFVIQDEIGDVPKLVRNEILLNAGKWLDRKSLLNTCKENVKTGYWFANAKDPSKIIVHELGHQLFNVLRAKEYNFYDDIDGKKVYLPCVLNDGNKQAYLDYYWSGTAMNQEYDSKIMDAAYKEWKAMGHTGSEEDFRKSISQYAVGIKSDGGVSLHETFAEAVADVYCNGDNASDASKAIMNQVK